VHAADAPLALEEIVVTAQKRAQSLQTCDGGVRHGRQSRWITPACSTMNVTFPARCRCSEVQENSGAGGHRLSDPPRRQPRATFRFRAVGVVYSIDGAFRARSVFGTVIFSTSIASNAARPQSTL